MTDILKHSTHILSTRLLPQQQILDLAQWPIAPTVDKVVPGACVPIQHRRRLDMLCAVRSTPLAFEGIVRIACCSGLEHEKLTQRVKREMTLNIFSGVHHT